MDERRRFGRGPSVLPLVLVSVLLLDLAVALKPTTNSSTSSPPKATAELLTCKHSGHRFVHDFIQFQCHVDEGGKLRMRPIGCVPSNSQMGTAVAPGQTFTSEHFRYACVRRANETLTLKITHCIDSSGSAIALGEYFMQKNDNGEHESMECVGDELQAKKVVFKWSKCRLKSGDLLTEGNFLTEPVPPELLRTPLQTEEIISCQRNGEEVALKCTGCVASNGVHVSNTAYTNVGGQWTQCRKYAEGCRLINVTSDYVNCRYKNETYDNGEVFRSKSGRSTFVCDYGVVNKQGCLIEDEVVSVGEVRYVRGIPLLCGEADEIGDFGPLKGCTLEDGTEKRFLDTWQEGRLKKRCSWTTTATGDFKAEIVSFACVIESEEIPLNKIVQMPNGDLLKCASTAGGSLEMRELNEAEQAEYVKRKTLRLNLVEYFGSGGKGAPPPPAPNEAADQPTDESCKDSLPFCSQLSAYCGHSASPETGLLIEAYEEHARIQETFERLSGARPEQRRPIGCEDQLTPFRKFQVLVELSCPRTCRKCLPKAKRQRLIGNLEHTSHCGW